MTLRIASSSLRLASVALLWSSTGCGVSDSPSTPTAPTMVAASTPVPMATPQPSAIPTPTPTPAPTCGLSLSDATFDPSRINCPGGTSLQTVRIVFELTASSGLPITINRVTTSNAMCRYSRGTCSWSDASLSFSPSVVSGGTRAQVVATHQFSCSSFGGGISQGELIIAALFVNTSCGAAREIKFTNTLALG